MLNKTGKYNVLKYFRWWYDDGYSYVCSAFAAGIYKAGGLLPENVNAVEFTPKDVYTLDIFDKN